MSTITQPYTQRIERNGATYEVLMARVRWSPSWGFMYTRCPYCDSKNIISVMRAAGHTHRPFTTCDDCRAHVGWSHDTDLAIRTQLRDLGAPIERRAS